MQLIQAYGCEYCGMVSRRKSSTVRHERHHCKENPSRVTCKGCEHFSYESGENHGDMGYEPASWFCLKKEEDLEYTNFNENIICTDYEPRETFR